MANREKQNVEASSTKTMKRGRPMKISNRQPKPPTEPDQWEYKSCQVKEVSQWGLQGWEAYAATAGEYGSIWLHLKRPLK